MIIFTFAATVFENPSKSSFFHNICDFSLIWFWFAKVDPFNSWLIPKLASLSNFVKCDLWGEFSHTVSQDTFISKVFWLDLTWTEAANGDARDVYVTLPSLTKSLLLLKKKRDTTTVQILFKTATEKYHFLLPGNYIGEVLVLGKNENWNLKHIRFICQKMLPFSRIIWS